MSRQKTAETCLARKLRILSVGSCCFRSYHITIVQQPFARKTVVLRAKKIAEVPYLSR